MVHGSAKSAKIIAACNAKKHAILHNHDWRLVHSVIRRIRHGKVSALIIDLSSNSFALDCEEYNFHFSLQACHFHILW